MSGAKEKEGPDPGQVRESLERVEVPWDGGEVSAAQVVQRVDADGGVVTVEIRRERCRAGGFPRLSRRIHDALIGCRGVREVRITRSSAPDVGMTKDGGPAGIRPRTPLQAELLEEGEVPPPDPLGRRLARPGVAPDAGYGEGGPPPLAGPSASARRPEPAADRPEPELGAPVFQWDVDPLSGDLPGGEAEVERAGWSFRMWWQEHPQGLVYGSIQAQASGPGPPEGGGPANARPHPVSTGAAVNLVYDRRREGVVAVYGTVRDFRPFVRAFLEGYGGAESRGAERGAREEDEPSTAGTADD